MESNVGWETDAADNWMPCRIYAAGSPLMPR
jgi:hypothetical protein